MPVDFSNNGEIIEVIIRDFSGAKIETMKAPIADKKKVALLFQRLKEKYCFEPEIKFNDSVNFKEKKITNTDWWE